ncbi:MAG: hypothetical protein CM15mP14_1480 [Rhodospirillaceae bacterium]|nr:MAG: hypothetical protein CM15mP14_1480 [Rhodospirillaceae bacterium]
MTSPGSDLENLDAVAGLICNNGRKVTAIKDSSWFYKSENKGYDRQFGL